MSQEQKNSKTMSASFVGTMVCQRCDQHTDCHRTILTRDGRNFCMDCAQDLNKMFTLAEQLHKFMLDEDIMSPAGQALFVALQNYLKHDGVDPD